MMSKLTVIIPLMKQCQYLKECIESIVMQNVQIIDVLIVRDFVSEEVEAEIEGYAKQYSNKFPIKQIYLEDEHGLSALRNYALTQCKGEYVYFMEPEDTIEKGTLQALLDAVPNLPVPIVYSRLKPRHRLVSGYHEEYEEEVQLLYESDSRKLEKRPAMDQADANFGLPATAYMVELRDNLEDFTVLGCMFHRSFLKENDIYFSTEIELYPDAPFICKALINATSTQAVREGAYIRRNGTFRYEVERNHNWKQRMHDYMTCYDQAYSYCISNTEMMVLVQETMCSRYVNTAIRLISKSKDEEFVHSIYELFAKQMKRVDKRVISCFSSMDRKHLKLLSEGRLDASIAYVKTYIKKKKRNFFFKKKTYFIRTIAERLFGNLDVLDRYIVFESGRGQRYYGDPKYIYRYLQEQYPGEYKCIWVANNKELAQRIEGKRTIVKQFSLRYFYYILRAKYWIKDTRQPVWWYKDAQQVYISTWLGTPVQKQFLDKQAFIDGDAALRRGLKAQVEQWDAVISGNAYSTARLQSGLGVSRNQIVEIGNPRNDCLVGAKVTEEGKRLRQEMGLPLDKKTILYAPVWREEEETDIEGCYKMQLGLHRMKEQLGDEYIVLVRIHDYITGRMILDKALEGFVYDFSFYDDVQELMLVSDMMITDYSSMVFDYACLKRPIFFYFYDFEEYEQRRNHFYFDFSKLDALPGPYCKTTQEIIDYIRELSSMREEYQNQYDAFYQEYCSMAGHAAERLARKMLVEMHDLFAYEDEQKAVSH